MTRIRFKGSPRSLALLNRMGACGLSAPRRSSPRNGANVGRWGGVSTQAGCRFAPAYLGTCCALASAGLLGRLDQAAGSRTAVRDAANVPAAAASPPGNSRRRNNGWRGCGRRLRRGRRRQDISRHRSDWYRGRAGPRRRRCSRGARRRELDLHQPDGAATPDQCRLITAFPHDHPMHQGFGNPVGPGMGGDQRIIFGVLRPGEAPERPAPR